MYSFMGLIFRVNNNETVKTGPFEVYNIVITIIDLSKFIILINKAYPVLAYACAHTHLTAVYIILDVLSFQKGKPLSQY